MGNTALVWLTLSTLAFEPNHGQADPQARFVARGPGYELLLAASEATLRRPSGRLRLSFLGARVQPQGRALEPLPGYTQYYFGNWRARVPRYGRVRFDQIYPGIDLVYYGRHGNLEYDLLVAPGADPHRIRLRWDGARTLRLSPEGDLLLDTPAGVLRQHRPRVEQNGRPVAAAYTLLGRNQVALRLGPYDHARPLVIDPILRFATFLGGQGDDTATGITVDPAGNIYVAGNTTSNNFPRFPPNQPGPRGGTELFLTKLNPAGAGVAFSVYIGGSGDDTASGIAVDGSGNIYVAGTTSSPNLPQAGGGLRGPTDGFVVKLDPSGGLLSAQYVGGSGADSISAIALDASGAVYLTGTTNSSDFPVSSGALRTFSAGGGDAFVVKLGVYATYLGGIESDQGLGIAVDRAGNAYVTGATASPTFPIVAAHQPNCAPSGTPFTTPCADAFVAKLNANGSALLFSTFLGGRGADAGRAIALDAAGSAYVMGTTNSVNFPVAGAVQSAFGGGAQDVFVSKFSPAGLLAYSTYLGGSGDDQPGGVAVDAAGNAWVAGSTTSGNFPLVGPLRPSCPSPCADAFVSEINPVGSALIFSTFFGDSAPDRALAIALDAVGAAYVAGDTSSAGFPVTQGAYQTVPGGRTDAFAARIGEPNPAPAIRSLDPISIPAGSFGFTLTVNGFNFVPGAEVRWDGDPRPTTFVSATQLRAEISGGDLVREGTFQISVANPSPGGGISGSLPFLVGSATAPTIAALNPAGAVLGDPGFTLSLTGSNFLPNSVVRWNGADRPTTFISATQLTAAIPASDLGAAGVVSITVFNPPPGGGSSAAFTFSVVNPVPVLEALSPSSAPAGGPDFTLTVTGSRFLPASVVRWNGADRSTSLVSPTQLRALIPASDLSAAGAAQVTVFNPAPGGGSSAVASFTITPAPIVSPGGIVNAASFTSQPVAGGTIAAIFGSNLAAVTAQAATLPLPTTLGDVTVRVDGIAAPLFFVSPFQINFLVPWEMQGRSQASVTVTSGGVTGSPQTLPLAGFAPALFSTNQRGAGQGAILVAGAGVLAAPAGAFPGARPVRRGGFLEIYGIGLGPVTNPPATGAAASADPLSVAVTTPAVTIGGVPARVLFAGLAAGFVGLYQINVQVSDNTPVGPAVPVAVFSGSTASNTVTVAVE